MHDMFAWLGIRRLVQDCLIFDANSWDLDNTFYIVFPLAEVLILLFGYVDGVVKYFCKIYLYLDWYQLWYQRQCDSQ